MACAPRPFGQAHSVRPNFGGRRPSRVQLAAARLRAASARVWGVRDAGVESAGSRGSLNKKHVRSHPAVHHPKSALLGWVDHRRRRGASNLTPRSWLLARRPVAPTWARSERQTIDDPVP